VSVSHELGERRIVEIPAGSIEYRERGSGPPVVFVHGVGVNGDLWRRVVPQLAGDGQCISPDFPLGAHSHPLHEDTDMSCRDWPESSPTSSRRWGWRTSRSSPTTPAAP
jgi:pimeloyl-ACP methyl ester carboxylesterase